MPAKPGDILLVRTNHFVSRLIRFGQRGYGKPASEFNHCAVYVGEGRIVEALSHGVQQTWASKYPAKDVRIIDVQSRITGFQDRSSIEKTDFAMRSNECAFALSCVGEEYGWITILCIALKVLFKGRLNFGVQGTSICSGLCARSLERLGYNFQPYDPAEITPAYLYMALS